MQPQISNAVTPKDRSQPEPWAFPLPTAAAVCGLSIATLRRREKEGRLRFFHVEGRTLVCTKSLRALLTGEAA